MAMEAKTVGYQLKLKSPQSGSLGVSSMAIYLIMNFIPHKKNRVDGLIVVTLHRNGILKWQKLEEIGHILVYP